VQPLNTCEFTPGNTIRNLKTDFKPDKIKLNEKMCWDELFGSCFEHLLTYGAGGEIELDAQGEQYINAVLEELMYQYTVGTRAVLATGGLWNISANNFDFGNTSAELIAALKRTYGTTQGWVAGFAQTAADGSAPHLNVQGIITPADILPGNHAGGIVTVYDELKAAAPKKLLKLINKSGVRTTGGRVLRALFVQSPAVYNWTVN